MSITQQYNIGAKVKAVAAIVKNITQSSAAAATTQDGVTIDRLALGRRYYSAKAVVTAVFLGNSTAQSASVGINVQHSSDGTSWDNYSTGTVPDVTALGPSSNSTNGNEVGVVEQSINLNGARRYLRVQIPAPTVSSSSAGNSVIASGTFVFGGGDELPVA